MLTRLVEYLVYIVWEIVINKMCSLKIFISASVIVRNSLTFLSQRVIGNSVAVHV